MTYDGHETVPTSIIPNHSTLGSVHFPRLIVGERCIKECGLSFRLMVDRAIGKAALNPELQYDVLCPGPGEGLVPLCRGDVACTGAYAEAGEPVKGSSEYFQLNLIKDHQGLSAADAVRRVLEAGAQIHDYSELSQEHSA